MVKVGWILIDVYAGRLSGLEDKLLCYFKLVGDMVEVWHPGVCGLYRWTSIPEKEAGGF